MSTEHLDDQALSAILDGEEPPSPHLDGCDDCRARSEELLATARLVGAAVPPPDSQRRETAIAAALDALRPVRTRWRPPPAAFAAAAVLLAIAALVPLLLTRSGESDDRGSATVADRDTRAVAENQATGGGGGASSEAAGDAGTTSAARVGPVMAGDLGTIDDDSQLLHKRIVEALNAPPNAPPDTPVSCEDDVRSMDRKAGRLVLFGQATVHKRAGFVLVFELSGSDPVKLTGYVVAQDDCAQILQFVSFDAP